MGNIFRVLDIFIMMNGLITTQKTNHDLSLRTIVSFAGIVGFNCSKSNNKPTPKLPYVLNPTIINQPQNYHIMGGIIHPHMAVVMVLGRAGSLLMG